MAAHSFLLARARDINHVPQAAEAQDNPDGHKPENNGGERTALAPMTTIIGNNGSSNNGHDTALNPEKVSLLNGPQQGDQEGNQTTATHGGKRGQLRNRVEELGGGSVLKRLKPLLDSFIREDEQRSGALPAELFRKILTEGHGGLWPGLGDPKAGWAYDAIGGVQGLTRHSGEDSLCTVNTRPGMSRSLWYKRRA